MQRIGTGTKEFRGIVQKAALLLCYETTRDVPLADVTVETPVCKTTGKTIETKFAVVPTLRAGTGFLKTRDVKKIKLICPIGCPECADKI